MSAGWRVERIFVLIPMMDGYGAMDGGLLGSDWGMDLKADPGGEIGDLIQQERQREQQASKGGP